MEKHTNTPGVVPVPAGTPASTPDGRSFIGGRSREFGGKSKKPSDFEADPRTGAVSESKTDEVETVADSQCPACGNAAGSDWMYCSVCGIELGRGEMAKALNITLTEDDLSEYLFKGYLAKEVVLLAGKKAMFKTLLPKESYEIENKMMSAFEKQDVTQNHFANTYALHNLSYGWIKFDGQPLGGNADERKERLESTVGVHLLDIASKKWNQFNKAVVAMLEDPDAIKN